MKKSARGQKPAPKEERKPATPQTVDSTAPKGALETGAETKNYAGDPDCIEKAGRVYDLIARQFKNQSEQSQVISEYWNIYNAVPDENLQYAGNSQGYVPAVRDCINARAKRALKQLFPANHKHVEAIAADGHTPYAQLSLMEHYIRKQRLKSIVRTDLVAGDVTGQWGLMVDWTSSKRRVRELVQGHPMVTQIDGEDATELGIEDPSEDEERLEETEVVDQGPEVIEFSVEDLAVIPPTCNSIQKATIVALRMRYTKERVQELVDEGTWKLPEGQTVDELFKSGGGVQKPPRDRAVKQTEDAGIKTEGTDKHLLVYVAYCKMQLGGEHKVSTLIYFAGRDEILAILRNPLWSAKIPIISEPVERVVGSFFGKSKIEPVKFMQWNLCDFWNMAQDSAMYTLLPVWAVDPMKTPQWAQLTMGLAAIWPVSPDGVKPLTQPQLWKESAGICELTERRIWQSLDVNEMMMGKTPPGRKNNALIGKMSQEQEANISDHAERYEEAVLNPLVEMLFEFDQQFRTEDVSVESRGEAGAEVSMMPVPPQQWGSGITFKWSGTAFAINMQRLQHQIAWVNVIKSVPPQMMQGRRLDLVPFLESGTENIFGPELAPKIFIDERNMFHLEPEVEDEIMANGMVVETHEADDDRKHIQAHMRAAQLTQDPQGIFKQHMAAHMDNMKRKQERAMGMQMAGAPGAPPGSAPAGAAGTPRPGAQPAPGRPMQNPPGAIQQDNMLGAPGRG